ncbi:MAG: rRNA maturation RNase YbeY [Candidatus Harrisonbacteria bacterium]|nr:rRNA maturation RNase YbeY [Candidatus Harrisonbacteria bacterium]
MIAEVILLDGQVKNFKKEVIKKARQLAGFLPKKGTIEIYLIGSRRMKMLNKKFRGQDKATNVLSFQKPKGFPGTKLGEVYLDTWYIRKHKESLELMLAHGVLHILGYDHEKRSDRIKMEKKERQLLSKLVV